MSDDQNSNWSSRLEKEISHLENMISTGAGPLSSEQLDRLQNLVAEMERVVNGNSAR